MNTRKLSRKPLHGLGLGAGLVIAGVVLAACGSGSSGGGSSATGAASAVPAGSTASGAASGSAAGAAGAVATTTGSLGTYLTTASGRTLYDFAADKGSTSTCYGSCATYWPPLLTTGTPTASGGADAAKLGTTKRTDGTMQVTYGGHPLYTYVADSVAGETKGQGVNANGGLWWVVGTDGTPITSAGGTSSAGTSSAASSMHSVRKY
jgi:predicted lipoprotein with Yx(FWY)xxD motif